MSIRGQYMKDKKTEQVRLSNLKHIQVDEYRSQGGELGYLRQTAFRGFKEDIEKLNALGIPVNEWLELSATSQN